MIIILMKVDMPLNDTQTYLGKTPLNKCPGYDTKQSDGEVPVMLELWGMQSTPSLPSLLGPLWLEVVVPDKGPIYGLNRTKPWFGVTVFDI